MSKEYLGTIQHSVTIIVYLQCLMIWTKRAENAIFKSLSSFGLKMMITNGCLGKPQKEKKAAEYLAISYIVSQVKHPYFPFIFASKCHSFFKCGRTTKCIT